MTGHGEGQRQEDGVAASAEIRTVNNRYFKMSLRASEGYNSLEPQIETLVRKYIRRGSVQISLRLDSEPTADDYQINAVVVEGYQRQLQTLWSDNPPPAEAWSALLTLPGIVNERGGKNRSSDADWPLIEKTLREALENLARMRTEEGAAMAVDLQQNGQIILEQLQAIERRAPLVVEAYRKRLTEKLEKLLQENRLPVETIEVVREVGVFAERSDISEETVRLNSHLEQFRAIMGANESNGRKLEFLIQEMLRETNTIGSKANDAEIARHVIEIKTSIERMREMIQNIE